MERTVAVFSEEPTVFSAFSERCPGFTFVSGVPHTDASVWIVDADSHESLEHASNQAVRIILHGPDQTVRTDPWDLPMLREEFLAHPLEPLQTAARLAVQASRVDGLEQELGSVGHVHDLMQLHDAGAISERVTRSVLGFLEMSTAELLLHDPRLERYVASFTNDPDWVDSGEFLPGVPPEVLQKALASGQFIAFDPQRRLVIMPLHVGDDLIGVIRVPLRAHEQFDLVNAPRVTRYLRAVVPVLSNVYQLTRSRELAMRDDLTKAFNRRFFESYLDEEIERSRRYGALLSIIFLDLDDLKSINKSHGHLTGSRTLQEVAKRILGAVRAIDKVIRFGGDEFCIVLPQTETDQAIGVANRVRKALVAAPFELEPEISVSITASFGIATYPIHASNKEELVRQADLAMYRVKWSTKNAVGLARRIEAEKPASV